MLAGLNSEQDSEEQRLSMVQSLPTCSRECKRVRGRENRPERRGTSYDITPRSGLFSHAHTDAKFTLLAATTRQQLLIPSWSRRTRFAMVYIRQDKLPKLKEYKYSGVDHSLLSQYVLKPFYTHVVIKCFPMWMA